MCKGPFKIEYAQEKLKQNAGHGGIARVKLVGSKTLEGFLIKSTSGVEANAYVRLLDMQIEEEGYMPKLALVTLKKVTYCFLDEDERESAKKKFFLAVRDQKLGALECEIVFEDLGYRMKKEWKTDKVEMLDVKIGTEIFDDDELKLNGRDPKAFLTKLQMGLSVKNAMKGGADGYQVALSDNKLKRQFLYGESKKHVQDFLRGTKLLAHLIVPRLQTMVERLETEKVSFIGSSILFVKDAKGNVGFALIDIDHAVFEDAAEKLKGLFERVQKSYNTGMRGLLRDITML